MRHRLDVGLPTSGLSMAVIVQVSSSVSPQCSALSVVYLAPQVMVNSEQSGVAFSRQPLKPITANCVFIEAVYGLGEGLVSGELEADRYEVNSQISLANK